MNGGNDKYKFPQMLSQQIRLFGLAIDEAVLLILPSVVGFFFGHYIIGFLVGVFLCGFLRFFKKGKPSRYLYNAIYWYFPIFYQIFLKKLPSSHLRHWIK